jgi:hypothetical protein
MNTRIFALILGIIFTLVALLGFLNIGVTHPGMVGPDATLTGAAHAGHGYLLGLFPVNHFHNAVHLIFGLWGILAYFGGVGPSIAYARTTGIIYILLALIALIPSDMMKTTFGLIPIWGHDIWLHGVIGLIALYFGFAYDMVPENRTDLGDTRTRSV